MSITKKLLFACFTLVFAILLLISAEFVLRRLYPEYKHTLVTEERYDQIDWYKVNRSYLQTYFQNDDFLIPEFKPSLFRKEKTDSTYRILCLGGSSMFGVPYQMTSNIPGMIRRQLRLLYPHKEIEVINLGASAINTNVIRHFSLSLLQFKPDLVLIYAGHNEFYGPDGVGASWLEKKLPFLTQWKYTFRESVLLNLVLSLFGSGKESQQHFSDNLMKQVSNGVQIPYGSEEYQRIVTNFRDNLSSIITTFTEHHVNVIVSDIASNLLFPPFEYDETDNAAYRRAQQLLDEGNVQGALQLLQQRPPADSLNAQFNFVMGKAYRAAGNDAAAITYLRRARNDDLLKFRAPDDINTVIRSVADADHVPLVSADSLIALSSLHDITDTSLFWEHLHPKSEGYFIIANGFTDKIVSLRLIDSPVAANRIYSYDDDSLNICWLDLAFADKTIKNLTSKWPFKNFTVTTNYYPDASPELKGIVDDVLANKKVWDQGCYETAQLFWQEGNLDKAITTYNAVIEEYPYNYYAHYLLGNALSQSGRFIEAMNHYSISMNSNPAFPYPVVDLGLLQVNTGHPDEAIALLQTALLLAKQNKLTPLESTIYYGLGAAYLNKHDLQQSLAYANQALALSPSNRSAAELLRKVRSLHKN